MTYKLGDRVVIKIGRNIGSRQLDGSTGVVTSMNNEGDFIGVTLDNKPSQIRTGRIYFTPDEIEHDKNYIVTQILNDL